MSIILTNVETGTQTYVIDSTSLEPAVLSIIQQILLTSDELVTEYNKSNGAKLINYHDKVISFRDEEYVKSGDILTLESAKTHALLKNSELKNHTNSEIERLDARINGISLSEENFETFLNHFARVDAYLDPLYDTIDEEYYRQMGWVE